MAKVRRGEIVVKADSYLDASRWILASSVVSSTDMFHSSPSILRTSPSRFCCCFAPLLESQKETR